MSTTTAKENKHTHRSYLDATHALRHRKGERRERKGRSSGGFPSASSRSFVLALYQSAMTTSERRNKQQQWKLARIVCRSTISSFACAPKGSLQGRVLLSTREYTTLRNSRKICASFLGEFFCVTKNGISSPKKKIHGCV